MTFEWFFWVGTLNIVEECRRIYRWQYAEQQTVMENEHLMAVGKWTVHCHLILSKYALIEAIYKHVFWYVILNRWGCASIYIEFLTTGQLFQSQQNCIRCHFYWPQRYISTSYSHPIRISDLCTLTHWPLEMQLKSWIFQPHIKDRYLQHFPWNCLWWISQGIAE